MKDMRDFIKEGLEKGLCKRITAQVDWNLELSHIAKLNEEACGPALLFENVKDYDTPVITSVCTTTRTAGPDHGATARLNPGGSLRCVGKVGRQI